jgi:hypothetical protein
MSNDKTPVKAIFLDDLGYVDTGKTVNTEDFKNVLRREDILSMVRPHVRNWDLETGDGFGYKR